MLTRASLRYYAATNALVIVGVAVAVAVLGGALLVGASVRDSLRDIALGRLGATDAILTTPSFFRDALGDDLLARSPQQITAAAPLIVAAGAVSHQDSKRTAARVTVYGVDDRFFNFNHRHPFASMTGRQALVTAALATELGAKAGDAITLKVARPSDVPLASILGRREQTGERIRLTIDRILTRETFSEFSLVPAQGPVLAIYVPLAQLQTDLHLGPRVNTLLLQGVLQGVGTIIPSGGTLEDFGLKSRPGPGGDTIIESRAGLITDQLASQIAESATRKDRTVQPVLTYVANAIRIHDRAVPYSAVSGIDAQELLEAAAARKWSRPPVWLDEWAAADLGGRIGDPVTLDYYLWSDANGLTTASEEFELAGILPMAGLGGDATLTPEYPGITDAEDIRSWDPPFPVDLSLVRKKDEEYWDRYRAAPKAIITLADAQRLFGSQYGKVSSLRLSGRDAIDAASIDPAAAGLTIRRVRDDALAAARGTTDFGEYFLYFSFFLVVAALLLAYLFFAVGLEQRRGEVGILTSVGFSASAIRRLFIREAVILAGIGAAIGVIAAIGYSALILYGLRTWWIGAVGTTDLQLHVAPQWLAAGAAGAFLAGLAALWFGVRAMSRRSARALLTGDAIAPTARASVIVRIATGLLVLAGAALLAAAMTRSVDATTGFFGAGGAWLVAGLGFASILLRRRRSSNVQRGRTAMFALGVRHASVRPARSVLSLALIAFASFVLVSIGAFKKDVSTAATDRHSGLGGFALMAESVAPLMYDPNTRSGRTELSLDADDPLLATASITRFRLRPGDEASCLSLYRPTNPRILAPEPRFFDHPRFSFAASLASTAEERANPWLLLRRTFADGAIAAVADQTTLMYSLHLGVGDDFTFSPDGHAPVRLRIVGALADSFLQSELIIAEPAFAQLFPRHEGYRVWMIDAPGDQRAAITTHLEDRLSDFGVDVTDTRARWASYHQVENTYLATFQALGSLGLLLGTVGLGAVLARNVLERRREIGLLRAVGFSSANIRNMVLSEGMALVIGGVMLGSGCAVIAIIPALVDRAQSLPLVSLGLVMLGVIATGLAASLIAITLTTATPVVAAIKSE